MIARAATQRGMTLIELVVVTAVIGTLMAIAVPSMRTWSIQHQRSAAASELFALINQARSMAVSTSTPATVTVVTVAGPPGGSVTVQIGAPANWTRTINLGGGSYNAVGITAAAPAGPYTITPRGTVQPNGFLLTLTDQNNQQATVATGLLGDVTVTLM